MTTLSRIWPDNVKIPIIGITGEHSSGKTRFGTTIDPANTCYYDLEKSGITYVEQFGIKTYIDLPQAVTDIKLEKVKDSDGSFTDQELFLYWLRHQRKHVRPDEYSICLIDPINDLESGLVDWVLSRHDEFGFQTPQKFQSMKGVFWSKVNAIWKNILLELASRCQTLVFTTHTKMEWINEHPVKNAPRIPKGKGVLNEVATVYFRFQRDILTDKPPAAEMIKPARLEKSRYNEATDEWEGIPILPPRIPRATPGQIRKYIKNPPDFDQLAPDEIPSKEDSSLSEDERLLLRHEIAENQRIAAELTQSTPVVKDNIKDIEAAMRGQPQESGSNLNAKAQQTKRKQTAKTTADPEAMTKITKIFEDAAKKGVYDKVADYTVSILEQRGIEVLDNDDLSFLTPEELKTIAGKLAKTPAATKE